MKLNIGQFEAIDWNEVAATEHPGETGTAKWRTVQRGDARIRLVEYSPGYVADHWCEKGHVVLVVEGELKTQLRDGREITLSQGMSYVVSDNGEAHKSSTSCGAKLFIVD